VERRQRVSAWHQFPSDSCMRFMPNAHYVFNQHSMASHCTPRVYTNSHLFNSHPSNDYTRKPLPFDPGLTFRHNRSLPCSLSIRSIAAFQRNVRKAQPNALYLFYVSTRQHTTTNISKCCPYRSLVLSAARILLLSYRSFSVTDPL
jgi:hypothetical protein